MNITEIMNQGNNVQLVVNAADLKELFMTWQDERDSQLHAVQEVEDVSLSADEVAARLKVSKVTLWRWEKSGYLVPCKVGRKPFYLQSQVERLLRKEA